jgi:hypothetical protein
MKKILAVLITVAMIVGLCSSLVITSSATGSTGISTDINFAPSPDGTGTEATYRISGGEQQMWNSVSRRFFDGTNDGIYKIPVNAGATVANLELTLSGQYFLYTSSDGNTWNLVKDQHDAGPIKDNVVINAQPFAATGFIYFKIADYTSGDGSGPQLYNVMLTYNAYTFAKADVSFHTDTTTEAMYLFAEQSALNGSKERYCDHSDFAIYKFPLDLSATKEKIVLTYGGGNSLVSISTDNNAFPTGWTELAHNAPGTLEIPLETYIAAAKTAGTASDNAFVYIRVAASNINDGNGSCVQNFTLLHEPTMNVIALIHAIPTTVDATADATAVNVAKTAFNALSQVQKLAVPGSDENTLLSAEAVIAGSTDITWAIRSNSGAASRSQLNVDGSLTAPKGMSDSMTWAFYPSLKSGTYYFKFIVKSINFDPATGKNEDASNIGYLKDEDTQIATNFGLSAIQNQGQWQSYVIQYTFTADINQGALLDHQFNIHTFRSGDNEETTLYKYIVVSKDATPLALPDDYAAANVTVMIKALPATVTSADAVAVNAAKTAYDALSDGAVALVAPADVTTLDADVAAIATVVSDPAAAAIVSALIQGLPNPAAAKDAVQVNAANTAFNNLSAAQKILVSDTDKAILAAAVIAIAVVADPVAVATNLIHNLPSSVTTANLVAVTAAKTAFDALTPAQQLLVSGADENTLLADVAIVTGSTDVTWTIRSNLGCIDRSHLNADGSITSKPGMSDSITWGFYPALKAGTYYFKFIAKSVNFDPAHCDDAGNIGYIKDEQPDVATRFGKSAIDNQGQWQTYSIPFTFAGDINQNGATDNQINIHTLPDGSIAQTSLYKYIVVSKDAAPLALPAAYVAENAAVIDPAASNVTALIKALPPTVTAENATAVNEANAAYGALTAAQKALIAPADVTTLNADVAIIIAAAVVTDAATAANVTALIKALPPTVTAANSDAINAAKAAYDALTVNAKALISAADVNTLNADLLATVPSTPSVPVYVPQTDSSLSGASNNDSSTSNPANADTGSSGAPIVLVLMLGLSVAVGCVVVRKSKATK